MELNILIPSSLFSETADKKIKTYKIGTVARALGIFRCDRVVVYSDNPDNSNEISILLKYASTPPYLRKDIFEKREELEYAGVMPPLRIPSHAIDKNDKYREGIVKKRDENKVWIECGIEKIVATRVNEDSKITKGDRVTVQINTNPFRVRIIGDFPKYRGYKVEKDSLLSWISSYDGNSIVTSRKGKEIGSDIELNAINRDKDSTAIIFGSPERGVRKIVDQYYKCDFESLDFDLTLNTIPDQGSETIRTEEALFSTLSIFNVL